MKTSTTITAGLAALAVTPTLTNGVTSCPDGQFVPVPTQLRVSSASQPNNRIMSR